ncbi:MAG: hypothetical protein HYY06_20290 [Deltaproteobacteria bacterium]|nr:hypothetical protein [Deltaproteobacteria bacterium]
MTGPVARRWLTAVLVALSFLALVYARVLWEARAEYREGDDWIARGDPDEAIVHYRRAAHWYAPVNPWVPAALDRLRAIGDRARREGQIDRALAAYRAIRGSILGTRSFYTPMPGRLRAANRAISALMAKQPRPAQDLGKSERQLAREHHELLLRDDTPSVLWSVVLLSGFFTWIAGAFGFIYRGLEADGRLVRPLAIRWLFAVAGGLAAWVVGMILA